MNVIKEMEIGKSYLIEVHGWIMLKGVDNGKYKIKIGEYQGDLVATFYKPRGSRPLATHYLSKLMIDKGLKNNNRTEIIKELV